MCKDNSNRRISFLVDGQQFFHRMDKENTIAYRPIRAHVKHWLSFQLRCVSDGCWCRILYDCRWGRSWCCQLILERRRRCREDKQLYSKNGKVLGTVFGDHYTVAKCVSGKAMD